MYQQGSTETDFPRPMGVILEIPPLAEARLLRYDTYKRGRFESHNLNCTPTEDLIKMLPQYEYAARTYRTSHLYRMWQGIQVVLQSRGVAV